MPMQAPRIDEALQGLDDYEQMLDTFGDKARAYWELWGPLGEHMRRSADSWAAQQRSYLQWLRQNYGAGSSRTGP